MATKPKAIQDAPVRRAPSAANPGAPRELATAFADVVPLRPAGPTIVPAAETVTAGAEEQGITAWHNSKKVTALWCNASDRNAYAAVDGVGWRRLSNANDSAHLNLAMLASHAEHTGSNCNIRVESDNMIHEIYVW